MSFSSRVRSVFCASCAVFFAAVTVLLCPEQVTIAQQPRKTENAEGDARDDLPFRVYAQWALDGFDADKDGSLTKQEMQDMQSPLLEERYDKNADGKLSFDEIVDAIRRPSAAKVKEESARQETQEPGTAKYVKYANGLVNAYDEDKDGFISSTEAQKMRRPISKSVDANEDGMFSLNEIISSLAKTKTTSQPPKPALAVTGNLDLEADTITQRFLEASLKKNDKNGDGELDASEIAKTRWSTIRWQDSDTDKDGKLGTDELRARYKEIFAKVTGNQRSARGTTKNPPMSQNQANELMMLWTEMVREEKSAARQQATGDFVGGLLEGSSGQMLGGLTGTTTSNSIGKKRELRNVSFRVELYLLRLPVNSDSERLASAVKALSEPNESTGNNVRSLAKQLGISTYDQLAFSAISGRPTSIQSGASVPMTTGSNQTARGRTVNQQFVDVGLMAEVTPEQSEEGIILVTKIEKSDLLVTENEDQEIPQNRIVNWTYNSSVLVKPEKPVVIGSSSSDQHWILVLDATRIK